MLNSDSKILIIERKNSPGHKLLISGFGRCNITHDGDIQDFLDHYGNHGRFLRPALLGFTNRDLISFFKDLGLGMGDLVHITAVLEKKSGVLWLPPQAVRNFEGRTFVVVKDGDAQRRVDVKVGITGDDRLEILDGLTEGQTVLAP